jgi:hypothetical protein
VRAANILRKGSSDEPARVERDAQMLCPRTPCVVNLPAGEHDLVFRSLADDERRGVATVRGMREPSVVKQTMGAERGRGIASGFGYGLIAAGVLSFAAGIVWTDVEEIQDEQCERNCIDRTGSRIMLTAGVLAVIGGAVLLEMDRPTSQRATTRQWTLGR